MSRRPAGVLRLLPGRATVERERDPCSADIRREGTCRVVARVARFHVDVVVCTRCEHERRLPARDATLVDREAGLVLLVLREHGIVRAVRDLGLDGARRRREREERQRARGEQERGPSSPWHTSPFVCFPGARPYSVWAGRSTAIRLQREQFSAARKETEIVVSSSDRGSREVSMRAFSLPSPSRPCS